MQAIWPAVALHRIERAIQPTVTPLPGGACCAISWSPLPFPSRRRPDRILAWALRRQGMDRQPLVLSSRRVYILPTRTGWAFAAVLAVTFVAGINYGNGLAMLLCFWLAGFALVAMLQSSDSYPGSGSAMQLRNLPSPARPYRCDCSSRRVPGAATSWPDWPVVTWLLRRPMKIIRMNCDWICSCQHQPAERGARLPCAWKQAPRSGLFRTWAWLQLDVGTLVYPSPHGHLPVPEIPG